MYTYMYIHSICVCSYLSGGRLLTCLLFVGMSIGASPCSSCSPSMYIRMALHIRMYVCMYVAQMYTCIYLFGSIYTHAQGFMTFAIVHCLLPALYSVYCPSSEAKAAEANQGTSTGTSSVIHHEVPVGVKHTAKFAAVRKIIGRSGENMKHISSSCPGTKVRVGASKVILDIVEKSSSLLIYQIC